MGLVRVETCPVCKSGNRQLSRDGIASGRKDSGRHYLQYAADKLRLTIDDLLERIEVFQCSECRSYYCDPWLGNEIATYVFTEGAPDHMAGWGNFEHWLSSSSPNAVEIANRALYQLLEEKLGRILRYAEYGCPFQGFLLLLKGVELHPHQRVARFSGAMERPLDVRWTTSPRLYASVQRFGAKLAAGYHRARLLKERRRVGIIPPFSLRYPPPTKRTLLTQACTRHWGSNCARYGGSCSFFCSRMLEAAVIPFEEQLKTVEQGREQEFDLVGIFNMLDHTNSPLVVIRESLRIARHVVLVNHLASTAGKQHAMAFHESFPQWLAGALSGVSVEDLSGLLPKNISHGYHHLLVTRG